MEFEFLYLKKTASFSKLSMWRPLHLLPWYTSSYSLAG
jgi:hypothetical protein